MKTNKINAIIKKRPKLLSKLNNNNIFNEEENNHLLCDSDKDKKKKPKENSKKSSKLNNFKASEDKNKPIKHKKIYRPLLNRFIKIRTKNLIQSEKINNKINNIKQNKSHNFSSKQLNFLNIEENKWVEQQNVIDWLNLTNINVKTISTKLFYVQNKYCDFNSILLIANKKRLEHNLSMFFVNGTTEY